MIYSDVITGTCQTPVMLLRIPQPHKDFFVLQIGNEPI